MLIRWRLGSGSIRRRLHMKALAKELSLQKTRLALVALMALTVPPYANAQMSTGTAFSVAPQLLITNHHVIDGCRSVYVVKRSGQGITTSHTDEKYVGEYKDGEYHGQGKFWGSSGNVIYSGQWVSDKPAP